MNFWQRLTGLVPPDPLRIGTIASANANNTVTCTMANGGSLTVRGTGTPGDTVFIQAEEVRSVASGLTPFADQDV